MKVFLIFVTVLAGTLWFGCSGSSPDTTVSVRFTSAANIKEGAPVLYRGVTVGKVKNIVFESEHVILRLVLATPRAPIRKDDNAKLVTPGLLSGNAIEIVPGPASAPAAGPDDVLQGLDPANQTTTEILLSALVEILTAGPEDRDRVMKKWRQWLDESHLTPERKPSSNRS
jgi:ABC-type transporter Mla subunit MlaD